MLHLPVKLLKLGSALAILSITLAIAVWFLAPPSEVIVINRSEGRVVSGELEIGNAPHKLGRMSPGGVRSFKYRDAYGSPSFGVNAILASGTVVSGRVGYIAGHPLGHSRTTIAIRGWGLEEESFDYIPNFGTGR